MVEVKREFVYEEVNDGIEKRYYLNVIEDGVIVEKKRVFKSLGPDGAPVYNTNKESTLLIESGENEYGS